MSQEQSVVDELEDAFEHFQLLELEGPHSEIEVWVRGVPSVRLYWRGSDSIEYNITAVVDEEDSDIVEFELNAWVDSPGADGIERNWFHEKTKVVDRRENNYDNAIEKSYQIAQDITRKDLDREHSIDSSKANNNNYTI